MERKKGAYTTEERVRAKVCKGSGLGNPAEWQDDGTQMGYGGKGDADEGTVFEFHWKAWVPSHEGILEQKSQWPNQIWVLARICWRCVEVEMQGIKAGGREIMLKAVTKYGEKKLKT